MQIQPSPGIHKCLWCGRSDRAVHERERSVGRETVDFSVFREWQLMLLKSKWGELGRRESLLRKTERLRPDKGVRRGNRQNSLEIGGIGRRLGGET